MGDLFELMAAPFAACVILVGIHAYLGLHVIGRKVIFVDLALAQIAAFGATFGYLLGLGPHSSQAYLFSLGFALVGAAVFAMTRVRSEKIPQEAVIGIAYAVSLAAAILVADRAPEGAEHIKESLTGTILWVRWSTIGKTAFIYSLVGLFHVLFRKRFFQITSHPEEAYREGRWVRLWDFLFYVTFAFVVTSSVAIAGVLLVFSFLVIPAVLAAMFASNISQRLAIGWSVGITACAVALVTSYHLDTPTGPSVVVMLGLFLSLGALVRWILKSRRFGRLIIRAALVGAGVIAFTLAVWSFFGNLGDPGSSTPSADNIRDGGGIGGESASATTSGETQNIWDRLERETDGDVRAMAAALRPATGWTGRAEEQIVSEDVAVREKTLMVLSSVGTPEALDLIATACETEVDPMLRLQAVSALADAEDTRGLVYAVEMLDPEMPALVQDDALNLLTQRSGDDLGYDPFAATELNRESLRKWRDWVDEHHGKHHDWEGRRKSLAKGERSATRKSRDHHQGHGH